jgi:hypothetical protein
VSEVDGEPAGQAPAFPVIPHPDRLDPTRDDYEIILAAHARAMAAGEAHYRDPRTGYTVMTAANLFARGSCCEQGCRHCPYLARPESQ